MASSSLSLLLEVQEQDLALDRLSYRLRELPERKLVAEAEEELGSLRSAADKLSQERDELFGQQETLDQQVTALSSRISAIDARLKSAAAGSFRDQQAMGQEADSVSRRRRELEDQELEIMERLEPLESSLATKRNEIEAASDRLADGRKALEEAEARLAEERAGAQSERDRLAAGLPDDLAATYENLRRKLGGVGAARLVDGMCSGCHLRLPASERERVQHSPEGTVSFCEQCGRILVP